MTEREKWQTLNEIVSLAFMVAIVLDQRYRWRARMEDKLKDTTAQYQERRRAELVARFEAWVNDTGTQEVARLEEVYARP